MSERIRGSYDDALWKYFRAYCGSLAIVMNAKRRTFLANVNYVTFAICYRNSVCLSVVCDAGAP